MLARTLGSAVLRSAALRAATLGAAAAVLITLPLVGSAPGAAAQQPSAR